MGPVSSSLPSPNLNLTQTRVDSTNPAFRDTQNVRERLDITKPSGTNVARSQKAETRDYQNTEELAKLANNDSKDDTLTTRGSKRGGVLDISV